MHEALMLWEHWITRFTWGVIAKHSFNLRIADLPEDVNGKNCLEAEQTLTSNLYLCLGERGQDELHNRKPQLDLVATRYSRVLDEFESVFKKERNETFETYQLLSRKREGGTLQEFHSVLSELAARCALGALERRISRDVILVNMSNKRHKRNSVVQLKPQTRSTELLCHTSGGTNTPKHIRSLVVVLRRHQRGRCR